MHQSHNIPWHTFSINYKPTRDTKSEPDLINIIDYEGQDTVNMKFLRRCGILVDGEICWEQAALLKDAFALIYRQNGFIQAAPLDPWTSNPPLSAPILPRADVTGECSCPTDRTLLDVIWSCVGTIFLCTWVSMHPNLPPENENMFVPLFRRLKMMFCALIAPELILMLSMRQWYAAKEQESKYKDRGWTLTHGFFLNMGGFVLMKGEEDLGTVSPELLAQLDESGDIIFPTITQEQIEDKSKGDMLSKGLALLQALWFIIQCIGRGVKGLAVTQMEVATLALCTLSGAMYYFWWSKPLDVECRVPIYLKPESDYFHKEKLKRVKEIKHVDRALRDISEALEEKENPTGKKSKRNWVCRKIDDVVFYIISELKNDMRKHSLLLCICVWPLEAIIWLVLLPLYPVVLLISHTFGSDSAKPLKPGMGRVNTFYAPGIGASEYFLSKQIYGVSGAIFGALHCVAWRFHFPTHTERLLWQYLSVAITIIPVLSTLFMNPPMEARFSPYLDHPLKSKGSLSRFFESFFNIFVGTCMMLTGLAMCLYFPARIILLIQSCISLRDLPTTALLDVDWESYIIHF